MALVELEGPGRPLINREAINEELQVIIDDQTDPWGVKVSAVEVKERCLGGDNGR